MGRLLFSGGADTVNEMSTKAQAVLDEIQSLPPDEQREISDFILRRLVSRRSGTPGSASEDPQPPPLGPVSSRLYARRSELGGQ